MDDQTLKAFRFMRKHSGCVVGRRAEGALQLARAEALLAEASEWDVARVEWHDDDEPYDSDMGYTHAEVEAKFESNEWTGPFTCLLFIEGEIVASLSGIVVGQRGTGDPYCRVVEAELASEVADEIRQALGDALDASEGIA